MILSHFLLTSIYRYLVFLNNPLLSILYYKIHWSQTKHKSRLNKAITNYIDYPNIVITSDLYWYQSLCILYFQMILWILLLKILSKLFCWDSSRSLSLQLNSSIFWIYLKFIITYALKMNSFCLRTFYWLSWISLAILFIWMNKLIMKI